MSELFAGLGITAPLAAGLRAAGIDTPTAIQAQVIPAALAGKDVVGQSATGTGKTLAYLLPVMQKIEVGKRETQAMILSPTHELAMQIFHEVEKLAQNAQLPITAAPLIGQVNITRQIESLKAKPHIIVGSSGRILELIQKRKVTAHTIKMLIIDEADRLLDDNNWNSVNAVVKTTLKDRQIMLFSATVTPATLERARGLMREPEIVTIATQAALPLAISHLYFRAEQRDKIELLRKLVLSLNVANALVFVNNSDAIESTVAKLNYHGLTAAGIYGGSAKEDRQKALEDFRRGKVRLLVASDIAARGLDIAGVAWVFNLEIPEEPQLYLHRVGRTGRAGQQGTAVSLVTGREADLITRFGEALKVDIAPKRLFRGDVLDSGLPSKAPARTGEAPVRRGGGRR